MTTTEQRPALTRHPSALLLAVQLGTILLLPVLEGSTSGRVVAAALSLGGLVFAVASVRASPALTWLSVLIALPAFALETWSLFTTSTLVGSLAHGALAVFYGYTAYALIRYMLADSTITVDELWAVGATFTVLIFAFGYLFLCIQGVSPGSFAAATGPGDRSLLELLYLSGANLTSVGLSDVIPVRPAARSWVLVEQMAGVLYVAMVISRLVALAARHRHG